MNKWSVTITLADGQDFGGGGFVAGVFSQSVGEHGSSTSYLDFDSMGTLRASIDISRGGNLEEETETTLKLVGWWPNLASFLAQAFRFQGASFTFMADSCVWHGIVTGYEVQDETDVILSISHIVYALRMMEQKAAKEPIYIGKHNKIEPVKPDLWGMYDGDDPYYMLRGPIYCLGGVYGLFLPAAQPTDHVNDYLIDLPSTYAPTTVIPIPFHPVDTNRSRLLLTVGIGNQSFEDADGSDWIVPNEDEVVELLNGDFFAEIVTYNETSQEYENFFSARGVAAVDDPGKVNLTLRAPIPSSTSTLYLRIRRASRRLWIGDSKSVKITFDGSVKDLDFSSSRDGGWIVFEDYTTPATGFGATCIYTPHTWQLSDAFDGITHYPNNWTNILNAFDIDQETYAECTFPDEFSGPQNNWGFIAVFNTRGCEKANAAKCFVVFAQMEDVSQGYQLTVVSNGVDYFDFSNPGDYPFPSWWKYEGVRTTGGLDLGGVYDIDVTPDANYSIEVNNELSPFVTFKNGAPYRVYFLGIQAQFTIADADVLVSIIGQMPTGRADSPFGDTVPLRYPADVFGLCDPPSGLVAYSWGAADQSWFGARRGWVLSADETDAPSSWILNEDKVVSEIVADSARSWGVIYRHGGSTFEAVPWLASCGYGSTPPALEIDCTTYGVEGTWQDRITDKMDTFTKPTFKAGNVEIAVLDPKTYPGDIPDDELSRYITGCENLDFARRILLSCHLGYLEHGELNAGTFDLPHVSDETLWNLDGVSVVRTPILQALGGIDKVSVVDWIACRKRVISFDVQLSARPEIGQRVKVIHFRYAPDGFFGYVTAWDFDPIEMVYSLQVIGEPIRLATAPDDYIDTLGAANDYTDTLAAANTYTDKIAGT